MPSVRWLSGRNSRPGDQRAAEDRQPAEQRRAVLGQADLLPRVERADAPREAGYEGDEHGRHGERDERGEDGLVDHDRGRRIAGCADATTSRAVDFA